MIKIDDVRTWRALLLAQDAVLRAIETDLDRAGVIDLSWYDVLLELNAATGRRLRMQELAARTVLSRTRVSRLVDDLAERRLVVRQTDPGDGRACFVQITSSGRAALRVAAPVYLDGVQRHFTDHLAADEAELLTAALERVVEVHRSTTTARRVRR